MENNQKYFAFISYKREDEEWAKWLQHKGILKDYTEALLMEVRCDFLEDLE